MMDKREAYVMYGDTQIRPSVMHFAAHMERVLEANDHKGGWLLMSDREVMFRIHDETTELGDATVAWFTNHQMTQIHPGTKKSLTDELVKEAIDVANYAMMLIDPDRLQPN